ncbi:hypothetical protein F383_10309 [Gossypium arboreum]|uniref:Uncharacterized protein n=1 Tax=Gossypium arboreum TaxID=29729 RepID=A0A0B0P995_GOSAR|nr:hypothetical protein F383_10309 [Gossypium arboreum]
MITQGQYSLPLHL